jgi:hypothetical protein
MRVTRLRSLLVFALLAVSGGAFAQTAPLASPVSTLSAGTRNVIASSLVAQAVAFEHGEGAVKDPEKAATLYCEAARLGDAEALYSLGWMYANGRGVPRNDDYAATLIGRAAEQGHEGAQSAKRFFASGNGETPECMTAKAAAPGAAKGSPAVDTAAEDARFESGDLDAYVASLPPDKRRIAELVRGLARQYGINPRFALAIAVSESNLDIMARSPRGALGVMQLMPDTAARFGVTKVYEPGKNIRGGLSYLRWLMAYYRGDVLLVSAAYNAGEGAVDRNKGIPPFMETVVYVKRVLAFFKQSSHPYDASLVEPSPIVQKAQRFASR